MGSEEQRLKLLCEFDLPALSFLPDFTKTTNKKINLTLKSSHRLFSC